jgi:hypothetical protein
VPDYNYPIPGSFTNERSPYNHQSWRPPPLFFVFLLLALQALSLFLSLYVSLFFPLSFVLYSFLLLLIWRVFREPLSAAAVAGLSRFIRFYVVEVLPLLKGVTLFSSSLSSLGLPIFGRSIFSRLSSGMTQT